MKKLLFLPFLLVIVLVPYHGISQNIEINGIILDESNNPIPFVAVGIVEKYIGTASTEDGEFSFLVTKNELKDSLSISSLGYDPYKIKVEDYLNNEKQEIILIESSTELDEVKILAPGEYVNLASKNLKNNTITAPHQVEMLYRSATTENGNSKYLVENYIKIRARGLGSYFGPMQIAESRKSADYRIWKSNLRWHSINALAHLNPFRPNDSQHARNIKKFIWKKIGDSSYEGEDVLILVGTNPKKKWESIKLYIGIDSYKVYRIERGNTLYIYKKHQSGKLILSYYKHDWDLSEDRIPVEYRHLIKETHFKAEAFVYKIITDKKKIRVIPYGIDIDIGRDNLPYRKDFWNNLSAPPDTKFYKKIKDGLEGLYGVPLEKQYEIVNE
ncbi:carboxypeptidase-like regulatory domain-containing protein [Seonamhaeicola maritimus]|uniref:carboxypeptidase-like regulatory domain-containing protein n=1 Tax=Seonamhaeicola maritimus TaxID=2591822 RepID=UPI00249509CA|nr:carboxypeptidase-like regulatory domain-containing protein [Seonamhaeicola maritimus]